MPKIQRPNIDSNLVTEAAVELQHEKGVHAQIRELTVSLDLRCCQARLFRQNPPHLVMLSLWFREIWLDSALGCSDSYADDTCQTRQLQKLYGQKAPRPQTTQRPPGPA